MPKARPKRKKPAVKNHLPVIVFAVLAAFTLVIVGVSFLRHRSAAITDEQRRTDLLAIEEGLKQFLKNQHASDRESRELPSDLKELGLDNLEGNLSDYTYSEPSVGYFGFSYIICAPFKEEVEKFGDYPQLSPDQRGKLYKQLSAAYNPHRAGNNCFEVSYNEVKGTNRALIGPVDTYQP